MSKQLTPSDSKKDSSQVLLDFAIRFEDLTLGDLLGQGGYGKVYAGEWKFNPVAIKQYTAQDFSDSTKSEIRKEAMIMATVSTQSDFLVRLRGMILEKPNYSLVMEYMPGGDLFHLLKSSQDITWPMRYRIGLDITIGLHHLHERSVLHRDLKSLNVLLDSHGRAKLADFGLSTLKTSSASTTAGGFKGTVLWSAPELFEEGAKATTASDIYSLAMVLWELVSRKIPFERAATPGIAAVWVAQGKQEIVPEGTPGEFKALILEGWHKDPAQRPKSSDVAKRLDVLWKAEQKKAPASTPTSPTASSGSIGGSTSVLGMGVQSGKPLFISGSDASASSAAAAMVSGQALQAPFSAPSTGKPAFISESASPLDKELESGRAPAFASLAALAEFKPASPPAGSTGVGVGLQAAKTPMEDELLEQVVALKIKEKMQQMEEENVRLRVELDRRKEPERQQEIQRQEAKKKKTPPRAEPKKPGRAIDDRATVAKHLYHTRSAETSS